MGALLAERYDYTGLEQDAASFAAARHLLGTRVHHTREEDFTGEQRFDAVCAFEVLEHIEDDVAALVRWTDRLKEGGVLLLSVPANPRLYGGLDVKAGHFRRYTRERLEAALVEAGCPNVDIRAYGFPIGYVLLGGLHVLSSRARRPGGMSERTEESGRWMQPTPLGANLRRMVAAPFVLAQRPFERTSLGTGFVAAARPRPA
jgi:SAM-dependent methyltransferase